MTDNPLEIALTELVQVLESERVPYMVIGAVAGLAWGLKRATFDVDVTILAGGREAELVRLLTTRFASRVHSPREFVSRTAVLPLSIGGTQADVVFGSLPYEEGAIRRSQRIRFGSLEANVCTPEDLIVHKIISDRAKDLDDVREIARARGSTLDRGYLDPLVLGVAKDLARPEIRARYMALWEKG